jgi:hypothetical protein
MTATALPAASAGSALEGRRDALDVAATVALAAYSFVTGATVTYYVARYSPWGSVTLHITYPRDEDRIWTPAVRRMSGSMRQVERREIR